MTTGVKDTCGQASSHWQDAWLLALTGGEVHVVVVEVVGPLGVVAVVVLGATVDRHVQ